ncbi:Hsp33 family molecular chaperone HslO [Psychromonas sp. MME2]|uniref:Hsp33 family molecular chaperone HslO n=1 Tax=unclassified Psychromonas TaxID=2614957 RepID=UPI00339CB0B5
MSDQLQRFIFDDYQIRGEIAHADNSFHEIIKNHHYGAEVENIIGELAIATSLLTATLKFEGVIAVQIQGDGPLKFAVVNGNKDLQLRGAARVEGETTGLSFKELVGKGHLVITITPDNGERYQGIVELNNDSLSSCLEAYFKQSEQLPTCIILHASNTDETKAAGLLIQTLPAVDENHQAQFQHVTTLAATITAEELFNLNNEALLYRLYHEEKVRLFEPDSISFKCNCSQERCLSSLASIAPEEIREMLHENGAIDMHCEYCGSDYHFELNDLQILLNDQHNTEH